MNKNTDHTGNLFSNENNESSSEEELGEESNKDLGEDSSPSKLNIKNLIKK